MTGIYFLGRDLLIPANLAAQNKIIAFQHTAAFGAHNGRVIGHQYHYARLEEDDHTIGRCIFPNVFVYLLAILIKRSINGSIVL